MGEVIQEGAVYQSDSEVERILVNKERTQIELAKTAARLELDREEHLKELPHTD